jgi:hypothetical protein
MDALVRSADWAATGSNDTVEDATRQTKSRCFQRLHKLRDRDSNPNFLIQSQASYR